MQHLWVRRFVGGFVVAVGLAACSSVEIPTKKIDYKSTGKIQPLDVPPDLIRPAADDRFQIPGTNRSGIATYSETSKGQGSGSQSQSQSTVLPKQVDVSIERAGSQRWLVVKAEPEQLWPVIKDFWQEMGYVINKELPEAGVIETDWSETPRKVNDGVLHKYLGRFLDSTYVNGNRHKYRLRLERGVSNGMTEIYISHQELEEILVNSLTNQFRWQARPSNPDAEAEMLALLMKRLGAKEAPNQKPVLAQQTELPKATFVKQQELLTLVDPFDRAWRRVGLVLDRVGFTVEDRDRSKGIYFVRYIDPEADGKKADDKQGLFSKTMSSLKFWGNKDVKKNEQYQVVVRSTPTGAEVKVLNKEGQPEKSDTVNRILGLLYDQLR
jgi:outer membrane protein assembly factor BamC